MHVNALKDAGMRFEMFTRLNVCNIRRDCIFIDVFVVIYALQ